MHISASWSLDIFAGCITHARACEDGTACKVAGSAPEPGGEGVDIANELQRELKVENVRFHNSRLGFMQRPGGLVVR